MRLGCLPYLNVKPLVYLLEHGGLPSGWELVYAPPSQLAGMLTRGEIAAAPVSSFATFIDPRLDICPGICIAADGPVRSVLLLSRVPVQQIKTIALDTSSLSGAAMLQIILTEKYDLSPQLIRVPPDPVSKMLEVCDAAMVIGNPAMLYPKDGLLVLDLALEWRSLTGLPAVFAVWAGRGITPELIKVLQRAKRAGLSRIEEIVEEESVQLGLPAQLCREYLSEIMIYDLNEREMQGLATFRQKAHEHGLVPQSEATARL